MSEVSDQLFFIYGKRRGKPASIDHDEKYMFPANTKVEILFHFSPLYDFADQEIILGTS